MTADTDHARALEVLQRVARDCKEPGTIALVALFAAAVELDRLTNGGKRIRKMTAEEKVQSISDRAAAWKALSESIANVTKGVLGHG